MNEGKQQRVANMEYRNIPNITIQGEGPHNVGTSYMFLTP